VKLGILKTDTVRPELVGRFGQYPDMFMRLLGAADPALEFAVYDVEQDEYPARVDDADAYLITGSKASVYDDEAWIAHLKAYVRDLHARRKKLVGICFGHQIVAEALGGRTVKSPRGWGVGLHTHRFRELPYWHDGGDADFDVLVSHQDQVAEVAHGAAVLAGNEFCENAVTQLGEHFLTFQGHPEFVPDYCREVMNHWRDDIGENAYRAGMTSLSGEPQGQRAARWIINFLRR